ncbi:hypothetical protein [Paenibacillus radicis (ex Xue et al. 2023)]|uniref:Uncharacterized protein n=1 Tax=Paenibacillus radicis (ex Xue et al. 2023) TaxID=2972489 RepID=A0ABT1YMW2_9BACL|nr:hypothetical protein [Paenibacillus radicis (ex Xue et al. 2023)]MCR8634523.1 hypothetical protein [Paenibacillus radicis (ex Xue et al. 2023)]
MELRVPLFHQLPTIWGDSGSGSSVMLVELEHVCTKTEQYRNWLFPYHSDFWTFQVIEE